jgi:hypothetical protein
MEQGLVVHEPTRVQLIKTVCKIITFSGTCMTQNILTTHHKFVRECNAKATTEATFGNKKTEEAMKDVAKALADEGTIPSQRMIDYINKLVDERNNKNVNQHNKNGNAKNDKSGGATNPSNSMNTKKKPVNNNNKCKLGKNNKHKNKQKTGNNNNNHLNKQNKQN